jgi:hypothetical protein
MKRRAPPFKLLLFLLAGAIINVVIAWGFGLDNRSITYKHSLEIREMAIAGADLREPAILAPTAWRMPSGWPFRSMTQYPLLAWSAFFQNGERLTWQGGILAIRKNATASETGVFFPLCPLWPGFAINTMFYAAIVWVLFAAPGAIRRRVRRKRGQCAACGYSLREITSEKCPECGFLLPLPLGEARGEGEIQAR